MSLLFVDKLQELDDNIDKYTVTTHWLNIIDYQLPVQLSISTILSLWL